jgi:hypothetical protein
LLLLQIQREIFHEGGAAGGGGVLNGGLLLPAALGAAGRIVPGQRLFQAVLRLAFPSARASDCSSRARELLRCGVAAAVGVDPLAVSLERVLAPTAARPHLVVLMHVTVGSDVLKASQLVKAVSCSGGAEDDAADCGSEASGDSGSVASMEEQDEGPETPQPGGMEAATSSPHQLPEAALSARQQQQAEKRRQLVALHQQQAAELSELLGGQQLTALLGMPELRLCSGEVADITPACAGASEAERAQQEAINRGGAEVAPQQERRLAVVRQRRGKQTREQSCGLGVPQGRLWLPDTTGGSCFLDMPSHAAPIVLTPVHKHTCPHLHHCCCPDA